MKERIMHKINELKVGERVQQVKSILQKVKSSLTSIHKQVRNRDL